MADPSEPSLPPRSLAAPHAQAGGAENRPPLPAAALAAPPSAALSSAPPLAARTWPAATLKDLASWTALVVASSLIQGAGAVGTKQTPRKNSAPEDIRRIRRTLGLPVLPLPAEDEPESSSFSDHSSDVGGEAANGHALSRAERGRANRRRLRRFRAAAHPDWPLDVPLAVPISVAGWQPTRPAASTTTTAAQRDGAVASTSAPPTDTANCSSRVPQAQAAATAAAPYEEAPSSVASDSCASNVSEDPGLNCRCFGSDDEVPCSCSFCAQGGCTLCTSSNSLAARPPAPAPAAPRPAPPLAVSATGPALAVTAEQAGLPPLSSAATGSAPKSRAPLLELLLGTAVAALAPHGRGQRVASLLPLLLWMAGRAHAAPKGRPGNANSSLLRCWESRLQEAHQEADALPWGRPISQPDDSTPDWLIELAPWILTRNGRFPRRVDPTFVVCSDTAGRHIATLGATLTNLLDQGVIRGYSGIEARRTTSLCPLISRAAVGQRPVAPRPAHASPVTAARQYINFAIPRRPALPETQGVHSRASSSTSEHRQPDRNRTGSPTPDSTGHGSNKRFKVGHAPRPSIAMPSPLPHQPQPITLIAPFAPPHDGAARRMRHRVNKFNDCPAERPAELQPNNPCSFQAAVYRPHFAGSTPGPDDATILWSTFSMLATLGSHYGAHGHPSNPLATRTNLMPHGPAGIFATIGDLTLLPPGSIVVIPIDIGYPINPNVIHPPPPQPASSLLAPALGPWSAPLLAALATIRVEQPPPGSFRAISLDWTWSPDGRAALPAARQGLFDFHDHPLRRPVNGPTYVFLIVANGIPPSLRNPTQEAHLNAITARIRAFDAGLMSLASSLAHARLSPNGVPAPLPLLFDLSAELPTEPTPGQLQQTPYGFSLLHALLRSIRSRVATMHPCHVLSADNAHRNVVPHTSPYWETDWSDADVISELEAAYQLPLPRPAPLQQLDHRDITSALVTPPRALLPPSAAARQQAEVDKLVATKFNEMLVAHGLALPLGQPRLPAPATTIALEPDVIQQIIAALAAAVAPPPGAAGVAPPPPTCKPPSPPKKPEDKDKDEDDDGKGRDPAVAVGHTEVGPPAGSESEEVNYESGSPLDGVVVAEAETNTEAEDTFADQILPLWAFVMFTTLLLRASAARARAPPANVSQGKRCHGKSRHPPPPPLARSRPARHIGAARARLAVTPVYHLARARRTRTTDAGRRKRRPPRRDLRPPLPPP